MLADSGSPLKHTEPVIAPSLRLAEIKSNSVLLPAPDDPCLERCMYGTQNMTNERLV
jgi:hypothetical protein